MCKTDENRMSYRFDKRTEEEFKNDIENCTKLETVLMGRYVDYLNSRTDKTVDYTFIHNGVDNTGEFIKDDKEVHCGADFILRAPGKLDKPIEIKHCKPKRSAFHLKINHIQQCVKNNVCIINWMGVETDNPQFCILLPSDLEQSLLTGKQVLFWQKKCIKFNCKDHTWYSA